MTELAGVMPGHSEELLCFKLGSQDFAIEIKSAREIRSWIKAEELPDTPSHVLGVTNLRGEMLPVIDLATKLGLRSSEVSERSVVIVADINRTAVGLLVDAVSDIIAPTTDDIQSPPAAVNEDADQSTRGLTMLGDKMVRVLDLSSIFPDEATKAH